VERQLSNGIKLLVVESHRVPSITLRLTTPSGDFRDPEGIPGVSDATAALIRLGTKTRSSKDIAESLAELGASINFGSGQDTGTIFVSSLTENFDATLALLADMLLNPAFPADELEKWKTRTRAAIQQMKANPGSLASERMYKLLYPGDRRQYIRPTPDALDGAGAFLYHVTSSAAVMAFSETYNDTPNGRFGVSVSAFTTADFLAAGDEATGGGAEDSSDPARSRTNVGLLCSPASAQSCKLEASAYDGGALLGSGTLSTDPGSASQGSLSSIVAGASGHAGMSLRLRVLQGLAQPYAIRNDNRTSDGTQLPLAVARAAFSTAPTINTFTVSPESGCAPLTR
jgi:hypothetical protein